MNSTNNFSSIKRLFTVIYFLLLTYPAFHVNADEFDTFNVLASSSYIHDSNLFKLPSNIDPVAAGAERSDNIFRNSIGFRIDKKYSLQEFRINFNHVDTKYDNAKYLDFKANNYNGAWLWALTPSFKGVLSADRTVSLVPFQDLRAGLVGAPSAQVQNIRTNELQVLSMDFSPHNKWHLIGGYNKLNSQNSQTFLPETSFKLDSIEGGLKYVFPSQSYISFVSRISDGENSVFNPDPQVAVGQSFKEKQQELSGFWLLNGKSRIVSNIGYLTRKDDNFDIRDFSGLFGGVNYIWDITGKTNLSVGLSRRVSAFQTSNDNYQVINLFFINPTWYATSKINVVGNFQIGRRNYLGTGPLDNGFDRHDDTLSYGMGVNWTPRSTIKIGLNLQHDQRNSNAPNLDYSADVASVNGQLTF